MARGGSRGGEEKVTKIEIKARLQFKNKNQNIMTKNKWRDIVISNEVYIVIKNDNGSNMNSNNHKDNKK